MSDFPWVVNVGLPRTGTSSVVRAVELLGLPALHVWADVEREPRTAAPLNEGVMPEFLSEFALCTDTPFYLLGDTFRKWFPEVSLIRTTRSKRSWVASMIKSKWAGGPILSKAMGASLPYDDSQRLVLEEYWDWHEKISGDIPTVDLLGSDESRWSVLCDALGHGVTPPGVPWPWENKSG